MCVISLSLSSQQRILSRARKRQDAAEKYPSSFPLPLLQVVFRYPIFPFLLLAYFLTRAHCFDGLLVVLPETSRSFNVHVQKQRTRTSELTPHRVLACANFVRNASHAATCLPPPSPTTQLPPRRLDAPLKFAIADDKNILLLPADELNALIDAGVEFVQARENMSQVEDGAAVVVDLVEDVVAEEFEVVALAGLAPGVGGLVQVRRGVGGGWWGGFGPLEDGVEFGEEADEAAVFELGHHVRSQVVVVGEAAVEGGHDVVGNVADEGVDVVFGAGGYGFVGWVVWVELWRREQPLKTCSQPVGVASTDKLQSLGRVVVCD